MLNDYKFIKVVKLADKSDKKKFKAIFANKSTGREKAVKFGAKGYQHFTEDHLDEKRRQLYMTRHRKREKWNNPLTAGYWSYHFLWRFKTYNEALKWIRGDLTKKGYL